MSFLKTLGKVAGGVGGFFAGGPAGAAAGYGLASSVLDGDDQQKRANGLQDQAIATKTDSYNQRRPLRDLGLKAMGQIEAPIDMGNDSYDASNPFAVSRGKPASTATRGDWGGMTFTPPPAPTVQSPVDKQRQLFTAIQGNMSLPFAVRKDAVNRLHALPAGQ